MPKWWDTSTGAWGTLAIGLGLGTVLTLISPQVGIPIGVVITLTGIVLVIRAHLGKVKSKEKPIYNEAETENLIKNGIQPSSWEGLSKAEFAQVYVAFVSMGVYHGHADFNGLVDDQKRGKPLNGPCWRCSKPRFQKGDPLE
jgi:hypothetical protein